MGVQPQMREKSSVAWWSFVFLSLEVYKMTRSQVSELGIKSAFARAGVCSSRRAVIPFRRVREGLAKHLSGQILAEG